MKTKEHILSSALQLFNEQGTAGISTNHIAEAAGISPGNLYYHYRNKEAIIRALFEQLFALWDTKLALPDDRLPTLDDLQGLVRTNFEIMWAYRFVYRELLALLRGDAALHERFVMIRQRGYEGFREIVSLLAQSGVLNVPTSDETVNELADLCWLISEFWMPTIEINGEAASAAELERGVTLMLAVLRPYFPD